MNYKSRYSDFFIFKSILVILVISFFLSLIFLIVFEKNQELFFTEISNCIAYNEEPFECTISALNNNYLFLNNISLMISGINNIISVMLTFILYSLYKHKGKE